MLETWLSKESLLSNSFTEKSSSVRQCSKLLHVVVLGPIMNTSVFLEITHHPVFYIDYAFRSFLNLVCFNGV